MVRVLAAISNALFLVATFVLTALSALLIGTACWNVARSLLHGEDPTHQVVSSVSLLIISFALMALSKYIAEEEIERQRELRSPREARRSLTKFMTIIIVAFSLESLVMVFESRTNAQEALYPTALFAVVALAMVGLGIFQWFSMRVERAAPDETGEDDSHGDS